MNPIINWYRQLKPIHQLLLIGFIARMVSVIFSKGFGWADDHFLIIEPAQNWADGYTNYWLPDPSDPSRAPQGHPLLYVWLNYFVLKTLMFFGINDPQSKMYVIRFLNAIWSLLIIKYGYKILCKYTDEKTAWYGGLLLAICWIFPFMSVRTLAEFFCIPPLLMATWYFIKDNPTTKNYLIGGLLIGLAFSLRFQSVLYSAGIGLALILTRTSIKNIFVTLLSFGVFIALTQGVTDQIIWKKPFAEFLSYVEYNINNAGNYGTDVWYMYFALILGLLIPPLSFGLFGGWFYIWRKIPFLFWPALIFLAFHTYFPNKQERFIVTILPTIIIGGTIGLKMIFDKRSTNLNSKFIRYSWHFVVILNTLLLIGLSTSYSKRHRCEAAYYLYHKSSSVNFMIEDSNKENDFLLPPLYYYGRGRWPSNYGINKTYTADSALHYFKVQPPETKPDYVVFWQAENIEARVDSLKKRFPKLSYEATIDPSLIDKVLYWLNPLNDNQTAYIYKINE